MTSLLNTPTASDKQIYWIAKLIDEKDIPAELRTEIKDGLAVGFISKANASKYLDILFAKNTPTLTKAGAVTEIGFYRDTEGLVYRVKKSGIGKLYAQQVTSHGFAYKAGKINDLTASMKMTPEEIRAYGCETGICANCSTLLTDPISIFIGLGTKCGPTILGKEAYNAAKKAAKADPNTIEALKGKEALKAPAVIMEEIDAETTTPIVCSTCGRKTTGTCCNN